MKAGFIDWIKNFVSDYLTFSGQLVPQRDAEQTIREDVSFRGTNIAILVLAILIASLGLNTNSTAVIIGAMLISPLMGPIIGLGLGVGIYDFELIKRALRNLVIAAVFSVVASTIYFLISPVSEGHSELLARTSPTIYDVLIGFVGGGAGILAIGSRSKGNVIPGVAIATALMPPLCTAGYGLASWQMNYFLGAVYLFVINSIYIAFATFIGVKLLGYKGVSVVDNSRARRVMRVVYALAIFTMLPSVWLTYNMLRENKFNMRASEFVRKECVFSGTQVLSEKPFFSRNQKMITITLIGQPLDIDSLELAMTPRLKFYGLEGTALQFVQGGVIANTLAASSENIRDVYQLAQATIMQQQRQIDSLSRIVSLSAHSRSVGSEIAPELRVLFPEIGEVAVSTDVFADVNTGKLDTLNIVLVHYVSPISVLQYERFREYMQARLKIKSIDIVDVTHLKSDV